MSETVLEETLVETSKKGIQILTEMPAISIKAEPLTHIFDFKFTNSQLLSIIVIISFLLMALRYSKESKQKIKSGFYYFMHFIISSIYSLFKTVLGEKINYFFPLIFSFFAYILLQNWFGLLPGVGSILLKIEENGHQLFAPILRGGNADLNGTFALAIISVVMIQVYGVKFLGFGGYLKKFINLSNPINFALGFLEIVSEFSKILSFSFRLFGNIFAGEVLLTIVAFLVPVLASFPFILLEVFVGFIQALVFSMLTSVFISGAIAKHH
ncbi:MAG: ATP synthase subunit a [Candidatus Roizmanbacteria bacterium GW2011_GWA2_35_19]|uniref:ATP synthase subunit a n=2 Tax=Candidatus Roizmaniibacteriota TaxID=1752723 RepID=A0A0G0BVV4_9BACT|nr:MAG: ATP synthase subunit a [Candidatus Roizmanbacteria bacterium GW2011_GWC2_35_12]KKP73464.1 MAG: ATP synthase subunit a [Candidatus Roizmanbacteria bacterium GW2011_GWA2_35_19]